VSASDQTLALLAKAALFQPRDRTKIVMLPIDMEEITAAHITSLIAEKVTERRVLEYKERLPEGSESAKKEFLGDVCSFANSSGGDIIYGIRDERDSTGKATGVPESIVGLPSTNLSSERTRLESMIRDGIRPRIPNIQTRNLEIPGQGSVVLLRVGRSWIMPHMVTYGGTSRFYSRHSTGKYQLDIQEIGQAFAAQRSLGEQLRSWRTERIAKLLANEGPSLSGPAQLLMHFVPATALAGQQVAAFWPAPNQVRNLLRPSTFSGASWRYNADGFLVYSVEGAGGNASYAQLFRNGCLEYGDGYILNVETDRGGPGLIPGRAFEEKLVNAFGNALLVVNRLAIEDPIYFSCALIGVQGLRLSRGNLEFIDVQHTFDRQIIQTPEAQIDRSERTPYLTTLLPIVDSIWQANGYEQTPWRSSWVI
jgi:hypothetical protein